MRFHAVGISLSYVMIGCFVAAPSTGFWTYMAILAVAIPLSAAGLMANDILDLDIDKTNPDLAKKPLVSGLVSKHGATRMVLALLISSIFLSFMFFGWGSMPWLFLSIVVGAVYILGNKKALSLNFIGNGYAGVFCIYGGIVASGEISVLLLLFAFGCYMRLTIGTVLEGSIKDYEFDKFTGCRTAGTILGMKMKRDGNLTLSGKFGAFMYCFDGIYWVLAGYILLLGGAPAIHIILIGILAIAMIWLLSSMPGMYHDRKILRKALFSYEVMGQLTLGVLLSMFSPFLLAFLAFAIPSGWLGFFIPVVYGKRMPII